MSSAPIERRVAREAARWFVRLQGVGASEAERQACAIWRAEHADHERAWALAERFNRQIQVIPSELGVAALDRPAQLDRRRMVKALALLIAAAPAGLLARRTTTWREFAADERSHKGEQRDLTLPDGSRIRLNTDSAIDIAFSREQRRVRLISGEILVTTGKDPRPFLLETDQGSIRPVGTEFLVRQHAGVSRVSVLEGAVEVRSLAAPQRMIRVETGQQTAFNADSIETPHALQRRDADWTQGVLRTENMRLAEFAAELGRYRPGLLRCDPAIADVLISGAFQLRDTDQALQALSRVLPVRIVYRTRYWVTIAAV